MKIAVIGAGVMGSGIAQQFLQAGHQVVVCDIKEEFTQRGRQNIENGLNRLIKREKITAEDKMGMMNNLSLCVGMAEAHDCKLVIEAASENMIVKKDIFVQLDQLCMPYTILATNTSALSITELSTATRRERFDKVVGMHFFNPVAVMKLVEVVRGEWTSDETTQTIIEIAKTLGKVPIEVKENAGFVVNRILIPMCNEAIGLLAEGIASAEDIDTAMMLGANHPMGPLHLSDLVGNDVVLAIMEVLYNETGDSKYRPHPLLRKMVRAGKLGRKTKHGFFIYE